MRFGRDASDANAVIRPGGNDSCDGRAMPLGAADAAAYKITADCNLPDQIGMIDFDAAIHLRHPNTSAGRDPVQLGQVPLCRARLQGIERIVVGERSK